MTTFKFIKFDQLSDINVNILIEKGVKYLRSDLSLNNNIVQVRQFFLKNEQQTRLIFTFVI